MKKIIFLALGTIVVQQVMKYFNIKSFSDLKNVSWSDMKKAVNV